MTNLGNVANYLSFAINDQYNQLEVLCIGSDDLAQNDDGWHEGRGLRAKVLTTLMFHFACIIEHRVTTLGLFSVYTLSLLVDAKVH